MLAKSAIWTELVPPHSTDPHTARKTTRTVNVASVQSAFANRRKQVTAQLRQSFRRLKQLRTSSGAQTPTEPEAAEASPAGDQPEQPESQPEPETVQVVEPAAAATSSTPESVEQPAPQANAITDEAPVAEPTPTQPIRLSSEDPSAVRCMLFADTYVISAVPATAQQPAVPSPRTPCLWVGTASGRVLAYGLSWGATSGPVTVQLHKELQLQHRAPVVGMCILDARDKSPVVTSSRTRTGIEVEPKSPEPDEHAEPAVANDEQQAPTEEPSAVAAVIQPVSPESHQLLLCSEEQVKIFQLPTLRALHKFKFIDRLRLPGHFGTVMGSNSVGAETATAKAERDETHAPPTAGDEDAEAKPAASVNEVESKSSQTMSQPSRKSIRAFGVQSFVRLVGADPAKTEWNVVVARQDGRMVILSLPHLRKLFKVKPRFDANIHNVPCVSSLSDANYVFWQSAGQLAVYELCPSPRLISPALIVPGSHAAAPVASIVLPDWARPHPPAVAVDEQQAKSDEDAAALNGAGPDTTGVPLIDESGESVGQVVNGAVELQMVEPTELVHPLPEKYNPTAALHAGDVTIDSIKEYLNGDGTVTIKTIETSTEKRTLVEGGHMVTTLRETECVDGQVIKDDVLKFSTDDSATAKQIMESS